MKSLVNTIRLILKKIRSILYREYLKIFFFKIGKYVDIHHSLEFYDANKIIIEDHCIIRKNVTLKGRSNRNIGIYLGKGVSIREYSNLDSYMGYIHINDYCALGHNSFIGGRGTVTIGQYTMIGGYTYIISSNHRFEKIEIPFMLQKENSEEIVIGSNVWIGAHCVILPGVKIGDNCVIGAGSIVTKSFASNLLIAGNPANILRKLE